jgi:hypothetical protein
MLTAKIALTLLQLTTPIQYGGMPPWPDPRDWGPEEQQRRMPPPRHWGPQMEPCIYRGDCRGPRYQSPYGMPPYIPRTRPDRYEPDYDYPDS